MRGGVPGHLPVVDGSGGLDGAKAHCARGRGRQDAVHSRGCVGKHVGRLYFSGGKEGAEMLNSIWWKYSHEDKLYNFLDLDGKMVYKELLTYRENHPGYGRWETHSTSVDNEGDVDLVCETLSDMLAHMEGIDRMAVGRTSGYNVRVLPCTDPDPCTASALKPCAAQDPCMNPAP